MRRLSLSLLATMALSACAGEEPPRALPEASSVALDGVGEGPVSGEIDGQPFAAADVRFRITRFPGRERVDLWIADRHIERCGLPLAREGTRVWARWSGRTSLEPGLFSRLSDEEEDAIELHYERAEGRAIHAAHRAVGHVELTEVTAAHVVGRLRACFADAEGSCVGGTFEATPCLSRIDGRAIREPPGLIDEALSP